MKKDWKKVRERWLNPCYSRKNFYPVPLSVAWNQITQWRCRLLCESYTCKAAWNIVLTYSDENQKFVPSKEDLTKFWKRFRRWFDYHYERKVTFKYFQTSEFGDVNGRLHYHVILFADYPVDFWLLSRVVEEKWSKNNGFTHVRSLSPRHCYYDTKYICKKFVQDHFKSQSRGLGLDYAFKIAEFALLHEFKFNLFGYDLKLTRYQRDKVYSEDVIEEIRKRYARKKITEHAKLYADEYNGDKTPYVCYMTPDAAGRSLSFLQSYYCFDRLSDVYLSPRHCYDLQYDAFMTVNGINCCRVTWYGIFGQYFANHDISRLSFEKLLNHAS